MADLLFHGKQGLDANPAQAVQHFQDLANAADPLAMVNMAVMHLKVGNLNPFTTGEYFSISQAKSIFFDMLSRKLL